MQSITKFAWRYSSWSICTACSRHLHRAPLQPRSFRNSTAVVTHQLSFSTWCNQRQEVNADTQVHSLGDFYADLLAKPIPKESNATTDLPSFVNTGGDLTKEERAAKLFGTIKGSGYERRISESPDETWQTVNGVPIPPRPLEPENCCMSGCYHCVWDDFRDDIEEWAMRVKEAQAKVTGDATNTTPKVQMPREEVEVASKSMDDDGGGSESLWQTPGKGVDADELFAGIPVGIREFMNVEKMIRQRKQDREKGTP